MKQCAMSIFTRTPLHVGAGSSVGYVDQPIIRERHTGFPVIPGSSMKGVLAALWTQDLETIAGKGDFESKKLVRKKESDVEVLFGRDSDDRNPQAGKLLVGEGKLLAFPVRSARSAFAWCTCPLALARAKRDLGWTCKLPAAPQTDACLAPENMGVKDGETHKLILEEYGLKISAAVDPEIVAALQELTDDDTWSTELASHLVILSDEMFGYFVQNACEIAQHVRIDAVTGTAAQGGLFNQENIPAETMFYDLMHETADNLFDKVREQLKRENNMLQIGADATCGLGWCSVKLMSQKA